MPKNMNVQSKVSKVVQNVVLRISSEVTSNFQSERRWGAAEMADGGGVPIV